jgi:hypothetical protein
MRKAPPSHEESEGSIRGEAMTVQDAREPCSRRSWLFRRHAGLAIGAAVLGAVALSAGVATAALGGPSSNAPQGTTTTTEIAAGTTLPTQPLPAPSSSIGKDVTATVVKATFLTTIKTASTTSIRLISYPKIHAALLAAGFNPDVFDHTAEWQPVQGTDPVYVCIATGEIHALGFGGTTVRTKWVVSVYNPLTGAPYSESTGSTTTLPAEVAAIPTWQATS